MSNKFLLSLLFALCLTQFSSGSSSFFSSEPNTMNRIYKNIGYYANLVYDSVVDLMIKQSSASRINEKVRKAIDEVDSFVNQAEDKLKTFSLNFKDCYYKSACKVCQHLAFDLLGIDDKLCVELVYDSLKLDLRYKIDFGDKTVYDSTISVMNSIPPICLVPYGFDKFANVCFIMENVVLTKQNKRLTGSFKLKTNFLEKVFLKDLGTYSLGFN